MPIGAYTPVGDTAEGGCRPGAAALHQYIIGRWGHGVGSYGCYNPNSRAGSGWSLHREGRAIDVSIRPDVKAKGDEIFHWAIDNADELGLQEIQWYGQIWTSRRNQEGIRTDTSGAAKLHYDHVHIGLADGYMFTPPGPVKPPIDWAAIAVAVALAQGDPAMPKRVSYRGSSHVFSVNGQGELVHSFYNRPTGSWPSEQPNDLAAQPDFRLDQLSPIDAVTRALGGENDIDIYWRGKLGELGHTWYTGEAWGAELIG